MMENKTIKKMTGRQVCVRGLAMSLDIYNEHLLSFGIFHTFRNTLFLRPLESKHLLYDNDMLILRDFNSYYGIAKNT